MNKSKERKKVKKKLSGTTLTVYAFFIFSLLTACGEVPADLSQLNAPSDGSAQNRKATFSLFLTDAPNKALTNVFINIRHVEIWVNAGDHDARIIAAQGLGQIDLLRLQNGALLPLSNLALPKDTLVKKFRIVLEEDGHAAVKIDNTVCTMKTPSAQKSGLKINLKRPILLEKNSGYSMVIDFDANKSVVQQGNGGCLLKPVLKLKKAIRHDVDDSINYLLGDRIDRIEQICHEDDLQKGDDLLNSDTEDNSSDDADGGFDGSDPSTWPPAMTPEEFNAMF